MVKPVCKICYNVYNNVRPAKANGKIEDAEDEDSDSDSDDDKKTNR